MKLPKKIKIGCCNYKVVFPYTFIYDKDLIGLHDGFSMDIFLSKVNTNGSIRPYYGILETLLHECIHAVDCVYMGCRFSEEDVGLLSNYWFQVLRSNKNILSQTKIKVGGFDIRIKQTRFSEDKDYAFLFDSENLVMYVNSEMTRDSAPQWKERINVTAVNSTFPIAYGFKSTTLTENMNAFSSGMHDLIRSNNFVKLFGGKDD